ncbi:trypsin-like peptidase domain-containing protein [Thalassotalea sp. PS06]|uniref:trypsin-like peptidase domain-containing protein n=1 Tax=Thalassotalea sp. PS06 TaxID=2594005 RepID=UPI001162ABA4|nr:trypsin-like peptidase domain-containing protein [Thalassotalea sp. PS06]QDP02718.1 trypsin-like peptidase domain-containing protein [Thalassotalea sp. PS06]
MKVQNLILSVCCAVLVFGCANTSRVSTDPTRNKFKIAKSVTIPNDTVLSIYIAKSELDSEFYANGLHKPGKALKEGVVAAFSPYFTDVSFLDINNEKTIGWLLDVKPEWDFEYGNVLAKFEYKLFDAQGQILSQGKVANKAGLNYQQTDAAFFNSSYKAMQQLVARILNKHKPTAELFPATLAMNQVDTDLLIDEEKPRSSGTAFLINGTGDLLTAEHVIRDCLVTKIKFADQVYDAKVLNTSQLLDLAHLSTDIVSEDFLAIRGEGGIKLGEKVVSVSYPLKGLLASSPNLTLGNVTSHKALKGSLGLFQFSAPIQPGSSGGAIVSETGETIGVVTSTLNVAELIKEGIVPQNINFALNGQYVTRFLDRHNISYETKPTEQMVAAVNEETLASTAQVACYQ